MRDYTLTGQASQGTFSTLNVAMGMMATAIMANYMPAEPEAPPKYKLEFNLPQSYQEAVVIPADTANLALALQHVYENILANQMDFDSDTKKVIYDNLWDLYS